MFHISLWVEVLFGVSPQPLPPCGDGDRTEFWAPVSPGENLADICLVAYR